MITIKCNNLMAGWIGIKWRVGFIFFKLTATFEQMRRLTLLNYDGNDDFEGIFECVCMECPHLHQFEAVS